MGDLVSHMSIEDKIFTIRNVQVILDRDLAELYGVETKVLNQAVKRNIERLPIEFRFQLSEIEKYELVTNCDRLQLLKHSSSLPFVFTEQRVSMLSAVLKSETAIKTSIHIINSFVKMRKISFTKCRHL
ncbi:MAG: ORF6N domain-containing protein [Sulfurovaceae bacterium]|nr:ORF6N domain-containing protein [Sulfurovaceae bacterium]